jgi:hypothetical protein
MSARIHLRGRPAWLFAVLLAGCLDFQTVTAPPVNVEQRAEIRIHASFDEGGDGSPQASHRVRVIAQVYPGTDAQGPRRLITDTLWVRDFPIVPREGNPGQGWLYLADWASEPEAEVRFGLPRISRLGEISPAPVWHPVRRIGPDTLRLRPGQDLVLRLAIPPAEAWPDTLVGHWTLTMGGNSMNVHLSHAGEAPDSVVIPAVLLPAPSPAGGPLRFQANLRAQRWYGHLSSQGNLELTAGFESSLRWVVEIVDAPAAHPSSRNRSP